MKIGDKVRRRPVTFGGVESDQEKGPGLRREFTGAVLYIHPDGWYHLEEFSVRIGKIRECFPGTR